MTITLNDDSEKICFGISGSIGVSKIEPSRRPSKSTAESRQQRQQRYTSLRRDRVKTISLPTLPALKKQSSRSSNFETYTISRQLDKKQRFELFMKRLTLKPSVSTSEQAINMLNQTMVEVEDKYAPQKNNKFYAVNSKRYGRMHPIPNERIRLNPETGITELLSVGLITYIHPNGYFEIWTVPRGRNEPKRIFKKNGQKLPSLKPNDEDTLTDSNL